MTAGSISRRPRWQQWAALALVVLAGIIFAGLASDIARGDSSKQPAPPGSHVVREVFTTRVDNKTGSHELLGETWTLVGKDGSAEAFIGRYFDSTGKLQQAQRRDATGELVYWGNPPAGEACVSAAPATPKSLAGLVPAPLTGASLRAEGYAPGGALGAAGLDDFTSPPDERPITSHTYKLDDATLWTRTLENGGAKRTATLALDEEGYVIGFWSVTTGEDGEQLIANSRVVSKIETYDASVFDRIEEDLALHAYPTCQ